ncbi:MAG: hypothetical protein RJB13_89 [Pseudomonadota bacterium]|jgi:hypothetical protein
MNISSTFVIGLCVLAVGCSDGVHQLDAQLASQVTQNIQFTAQSQPVALVVESGACATHLPRTSLTSDYCFNPVAAVNLNIISIGASSPAFCVATHLAGMASEAALLVVDSNGQYVSEASGRGNTQVVDTFSKAGRYTFYVGFPSSAAGQKATLRIAALNSLAMRSPACSLQ